MNLVLIGVMVYVAAQFLIGILVSRRIKTESDYLLAGRNFGYILATFSIFATWFGAETCIGSAGAIYGRGLSGGSADPFGYGVCLLFMGFVFAVPLWRRKLVTIADLFRDRFSPGVERFAVILMVPTSLLWGAAQIRAFGQVLDATSGIGVNLAITVAAALVIAYTGFGGLRADVITDLIQGILLILGLLVLFVVLFPTLGESVSVIRESEPERLNLFAGGSFWLNLEDWAIPICGSVVAQELVMRVLAARTPQIARRATVIGGSLYLFIGLIPVTLGLTGAVMLPGLEETEQILPMLAQKYLPPLLYIAFAGALVSAILSTVDSTLLAASSLASHNVIIPLKGTVSEASKLRITRWGVLVFGLIAYFLAVSAEGIYELVESASSFGSAGIFIIAVFGLFSKWGRAPSAYTALTLGTGTWMIGKLLEFEYSYLLALLLAFAGYGIASVVGKKPPISNQIPTSSPA